jgi:hypothetical protein
LNLVGEEQGAVQGAFFKISSLNLHNFSTICCYHQDQITGTKHIPSSMETKMKKWILITAAVMFAAGLAMGGAYIALAQSSNLPALFGSFGGWMHGQAFTSTVPFGPGMMRGWGYGQGYTGTVPFGPGMMRGWDYDEGYTGTVPFGPGLMMVPGGVHEQVWTAVAQQLDLTYDQLQAELRTKTLAQLAQDKSVSLETLKNAAKTAWTNGINQLVEQGKLTREQADWMLQRMDAADWPMFGNGQGFGPGPNECGGMGGPQGFGPRGQGFGRGRIMPFFGGRQG